MAADPVACGWGATVLFLLALCLQPPSAQPHSLRFVTLVRGKGGNRRGLRRGVGLGRCDVVPPAGVPARRPLAHQGLPARPVPGGRLAPGLRATHAGVYAAAGGDWPEPVPSVTPGAFAGGDAAAVGAGPDLAAALPRFPRRHVPAEGGQYHWPPRRHWGSWWGIAPFAAQSLRPQHQATAEGGGLPEEPRSPRVQSFGGEAPPAPGLFSEICLFFS